MWMSGATPTATPFIDATAPSSSPKSDCSTRTGCAACAGSQAMAIAAASQKSMNRRPMPASASFRESRRSMCDPRPEYTRSAGHGGGPMRVLLPLAAGLVAVSPLPAGADLPQRIPVEALFANAAYSKPRLSEDGGQIAYVQSNGDLWVVVAQPIDGGSPKPLAKFDDPQTRPNRLEWANDRRIIFSAHMRDPESIGMRNRMTRLFGVDKDGFNFTW